MFSRAERVAVVIACAAALAGCGDDCSSSNVESPVVQSGRYTREVDAGPGVAPEQLVVDRAAGVVTRTRVVDGGTVVERYAISASRRSF